MTSEKLKKLKKVLEQAHQDFLETNEIHSDALEPALKFNDPVDRELVSFICSIIAYGKIAQVKKSIHAITDRLGGAPVDFLRKCTEAELKKITIGWKHRFNTSNDIFIMLSILKSIYTSFDSLEDFIKPKDCKSAEELLLKIFNQFSLRAKKLKAKTSFYFFIPDPSRQSASKRMNLFLKWMVRDTEPDLGLWKSFPKSKLIVPLDTHVHKQGLSLGFTNRTTADIITALEITEKLKLMDSEDPTRFDFALCHLSIHGKILNINKTNF